MIKVLILLFLVCSPAVAQKIELNIWSEVCLHNGVYSCSGINVPTIESTELEGIKIGEYRGGDTIYLTIEPVPPALIIATMYHEMIHYLQVQTGVLELPGLVKDVCAAEDIAYKLTETWINTTPFAPDSEAIYDMWWEHYPECWLLYDEEYARIMQLINLKNTY